MRASIGDEVLVETHTLGLPPRRGEVLELLGDRDTEHYRVRWEDGTESIYYPGSDSSIIDHQT
jgi:hypothetical protein